MGFKRCSEHYLPSETNEIEVKPKPITKHHNHNKGQLCSFPGCKERLFYLGYCVIHSKGKI